MPCNIPICHLFIISNIPLKKSRINGLHVDQQPAISMTTSKFNEFMHVWKDSSCNMFLCNI